MAYSVNGIPLLTTDLTEPRIGAWRGELEADTEEPLTGAITLDLNGITFSGTVLPNRSGAHGGSTRAAFVGGKGGLSRELPAQNYASGVILVSTVLGDILRGAGETLAPDSDASVLRRQLPKWHREAGPASHALVRLLDVAQATFRLNRTGQIWVGVDTYPTVDPEHVLTDEDWSAGILTLDVEAPGLGPGTTFRDHRIEQCIHRLRRNSLTTEAHLSTLRSSLDKFLGRIRQGIDYSRNYPCRVVAQNADGTLQLMPDDPIMKGRGLDKVPIRLGLPGMSVDVLSGARVMLAFDAGDPARPYAALWDADGNEHVQRIDFGDAPQDAARKGDTVEVLLVPAIFSGTVSGAPATGVISWAAPKTVGAIVTGTNRFRLGQ